MSTTFLLILGFLGQGMFGARTIAQWIIAEREGRVVSPVIFWVFSVIGASVFLFYGVLRHDPVIMLGQSIAFYIYIRNLQLKRVWQRIHVVIRILLLLIPPALLLYATKFESSGLNFNYTDIFMLTGMIGQLLLNFRYFYQWYFSEKAHESLLPLGFWIISAAASIMVVVYSLYRDDLVLLVAQSGGLIAYIRNIYLHFRPRKVEHSKTS
ncbi:MAG TPA: lipid-A-disaccharide synthase N-terminal domain-containing protein [Cyclobacteriaceae bacterium]